MLWIHFDADSKYHITQMRIRILILLDADPDPDPDPTFHPDADPDLDPRVLICSYFIHFGLSSAN